MGKGGEHPPHVIYCMEGGVTYQRFKVNEGNDFLLRATTATFATETDSENSDVAEVADVACSSEPLTCVDRSVWDGLDWMVAYDERAAILEHDEGLPRHAAARLARQQIDEQWRRRWH
jgi:hypothetical protein